VIDLNVCHREAFKSREASSTVESICLNTPLIVKKAIGNMLIVCTTVRPPSP